jgi:hypothetical protein
MTSLAFERVALTAFLEPRSRGPLWVWRVDASRLAQLCDNRAFDSSGMIQALLLGGCVDGSHPGRAALEDRMREAFGSPKERQGLDCASEARMRVQTFKRSGQALDQSMGFLDLLLRSNGSARFTSDLLHELPDAWPEALMERWGLEAIHCGEVAESDWDSYPERARAVLALIERSEIGADAAACSSHAGAARL